MQNQIPTFVISVLSDVIDQSETHATLNALFMYAEAPGDPPEGNKRVKVQEWLRRANKETNCDAYKVLGHILEKYLDDQPTSSLYEDAGAKAARNARINDALQRANIRYSKGGIIAGTDAPPVVTLEEEIRKLNIESINYEFDRALKNVDADPYEAVSAACNILESIFKVILDDKGVERPKVQDLANLWKSIKGELGISSTSLEDMDILAILSGLSAVISGIGALRTHASAAHGRGRFRYKLMPRHVLLAIHSAHTLALFVLQTQKEKVL